MVRLQEAWTAAWKPRTTPPITEWAPDRFYLSRQVEASAGPYNLRDYPYLVEILEAFESPATEKISIMASTQTGKTLFVMVALAYMAESDPAPALICLPSQAAATEFRDRFYANCMESPGLRSRVPAERKWNMRHIDLQSCRVYLAWSGSRQRLRGRPCRCVILSEVDVYQRTMAGDPLRVAEERTKKFYRRKIVQESTPVGEDSPIANEYDAGDKRKWYAKCPECGRYQELRFFTYKNGELEGRGGIAGYRGEDGELSSVEDARRHAHYVCVNGCEIYDDQKLAFIATGRWVRAGQDIDRAGHLTGEPKRSARHASFHLWAIHSNTVTFADIVEANIRHLDGGQVADFWQNWLGLRYVTSRKVPAWKRVGKSLASEYDRQEIPAAAWFLTAGCDVQEDGVYYAVRAWGHQAESWLIDWGFLQRYRDRETEGSIASDLDQIHEVLLTRRWPVQGGGANPLGKTEVGIRLLNIDANYRQTDVYQWQQSLGTKRVRLIVGDTRTVKTAERFRRSKIERTSDAKQRRGMVVWRVNVNVYKEDLMARIIAGCGDRKSSFHLPRSILRVGSTYLRQLVNEHKKTVTDRYGRTKLEWVVRSGSLGNHYWDTEVYLRAAADMVLAEQRLDWDSTKWPTPSETVEEPIDLTPARRD